MGRSCWQRGWNLYACQLFCASRKPWKTMGKSDFTLRLFLLACSLCEPGEPPLGTGTQAEKKKKKNGGLRILAHSAHSLSVCVQEQCQGESDLHPELKKSRLFIFWLSLTPVYTDDITVLEVCNCIQMQSCHFSQIFGVWLFSAGEKGVNSILTLY